MVSPSKEQKIIDLKTVIKKNPKARANLAVAFLEDETVRIQSQANSAAYLKQKEEEDSMPNWMWNVAYFALGILFLISMENVFWHWGTFIIK